MLPRLGCFSAETFSQSTSQSDNGNKKTLSADEWAKTLINARFFTLHIMGLDVKLSYGKSETFSLCSVCVCAFTHAAAPRFTPRYLHLLLPTRPGCVTLTLQWMTSHGRTAAQHTCESRLRRDNTRKWSRMRTKMESCLAREPN